MQFAELVLHYEQDFIPPPFNLVEVSYDIIKFLLKRGREVQQGMNPVIFQSNSGRNVDGQCTPKEESNRKQVGNKDRAVDCENGRQ